jgi:hypothetical protein
MNKTLGRLCTITGTMDQNLKAIGAIYEMVINLENNRKENK